MGTMRNPHGAARCRTSRKLYICVCMLYISIYLSIYLVIYLCIFIYIERESERAREREVAMGTMRNAHGAAMCRTQYITKYRVHYRCIMLCINMYTHFFLLCWVVRQQATNLSLPPYIYVCVYYIYQSIFLSIYVFRVKGSG